MIHAEEVLCPCYWCQHEGQSATGHRVIRYYFDDQKAPSPEVLAIMDEIVKEAIESAGRRPGDA